jgi:ribosomal-protein-alanine N-acetyltransferase
MTLTIQAADKSLAALLAAIHAGSFPANQVWDAAAIELLVGLPGHVALLALEGGEPVGFALGRLQVPEAEILTLAIMPKARGKGFGQALLEALMAEVAAKGGREVFLEVAEGNAAARALYARAGAVNIGRRRRYYADGADALTLRIALAERKIGWETPQGS